MMVKTPMRTETEQGKKGRSSPVVLGKINLLLALLGLLVLVGAYWVGFLPALLPETLALLILALSLVTAATRAWHARRGGLEYGLLRHPFSRDLRPYLLQCLNHWLFLALFGAAIVAGTFAIVPAQVGSLFSLPLPDRVPYRPLVVALGVGALVMAALALVPRRRVQVATNVLVAIGTVFLTIHLVRIYTPPADPVAIDPPLAGEWAMLAGGRSTLLSNHYSTPYVRDALDFVRLVDGRGYEGDPKRAESWYGFGGPVLAPADGTVVSVSDVHPDEPIGKTGLTPSYGNHVLLEIGKHRYAMLAHLKQGSARVSEGERVGLGQRIAAVGDSGDSLWPHLHFHVQDSPDLDHQARTVPVVLSDVLLIRNGRESTLAEADLRRGDRIRRIEDWPHVSTPGK
jgi:murein DD-endopeptidase MepM/ murein hydrolase activator NlpD